MAVLIIGADGSMGKRYQAIMSYLGTKTLLADKNHSITKIKELADQADGIIVATPTDTHVSIVREVLAFRKPILCEKPVSKNLLELKTLQAEIHFHRTPFRMVMQYEMLADPIRIGRSYYNYFRHGSDGLVWDCMQIVGLARTTVSLAETSPVWGCMINGKSLNLQHMDAAYVGYVQKWFRDPAQEASRIYEMHEKTDDHLRSLTNVAHH